MCGVCCYGDGSKMLLPTIIVFVIISGVLDSSGGKKSEEKVMKKTIQVTTTHEIFIDDEDNTLCGEDNYISDPPGGRKYKRCQKCFDAARVELESQEREELVMAKEEDCHTYATCNHRWPTERDYCDMCNGHDGWAMDICEYAIKLLDKMAQKVEELKQELGCVTEEEINSAPL